MARLEVFADEAEPPAPMAIGSQRLPDDNLGEIGGVNLIAGTGGVTTRVTTGGVTTRVTTGGVNREGDGVFGQTDATDLAPGSIALAFFAEPTCGDHSSVFDGVAAPPSTLMFTCTARRSVPGVPRQPISGPSTVYGGLIRNGEGDSTALSNDWPPGGRTINVAGEGV